MDAALRFWTVLPVLALCGLLPARPAHGQVIESAYPDDVPGFDSQQGVSVTSRIQSDTAWQEIPLGAELLHPEVTESISNDSAILAGRQPSWIVETAPSVTLSSADSGSGVAAVASADNSRYLVAPEQSDTDWTAAVGGTFDIADCTVTAAIAHLTLHENDTALDAAQYDAPLAFSVDTLRLSGQTPASRLTLEPSLDLTRFAFGSATVDGVPDPQSYRDRLVVKAGLTLSYGIEEYQDPTRLQLTIQPAAGFYPNQSLGEPPRSFVGGTVLLGVEHDLDGLWGWRFQVGAGGRVYRGSYQSQLVPLAEASVTWQPTERTTWHAALFRQIEDAADEGVGGYVSTIGGVAMDHELQRDLILHLGSDIDRADFGGGSSETFITGRVGLQWLISSMFRLGGTVTLTDHQSTMATPYGENVFLLSMTAGL
jgi:hypothetical protein